MKQAPDDPNFDPFANRKPWNYGDVYSYGYNPNEAPRQGNEDADIGFPGGISGIHPVWGVEWQNGVTAFF